MNEKLWDLIIIGAGPSALTAAIYTAREDMSTLMIEKGVIGGLMATIDKIENYPGFPEGIEGLTLAMDFQAQAEKFGAQVELAEVTGVLREKDNFLITTDAGDFHARSVLVSTGNEYRKLGIPGEEQAHYCATCDGAFYRDKKLAVIGGANAAIQEAMFLTKFATHIDLIVRSWVKASEILQRELKGYIEQGKITLHEGTTPDEIVIKDGQVTGIATHQTDKPEQKETFDVDGVFVFAGVIPNAKFLTGSGVEFDNVGHVMTDHELMTAVPGVFASGDVRSGATKQVASAVGEGTTAALNIREYLNDLDKKNDA
ncbi:FAD-dependent oxidoreductase [Candidatus Saccharibacteria bacterium]|nr:FAD-dependent oxidoreductase [Candidatus Saccharibacteria bacterium]